MQINTRSKEYYLSISFIILTVIFWGISFISTKLLLEEIPPVSIAFFRQLIAIVPLAAFSLHAGAFSRIPLKHSALFCISGFFGIVLYFIFENIGLKYTTASNASLIVAALPIFTLIAEVLFFKQKTNLKIISSILFSIIGVYLVISTNGRVDFSSSAFFGNLLVIVSMICWVVYTIVSRSLSEKYSGLLITTYQTAFSIFLFIPFILHEIDEWKKITFVSLLNLLYLGLCCSALAYLLYVYAAKRLGSTISALFLNLIPVVSVVTSFIVLNEKLSIIQIIGMLLIMASLFYLSKK